MWLIKLILKEEICRQFIKFCLVGLGNTIIDYFFYLLLNRFLGVYFLYANLISVAIAMTASFIFNKYWTFRDKGSNIKTQYLKFAGVNLIYFILNNSMVFALVKYLQLYDLLAKVIAIIVGLLWNFCANRYWTFKKPILK
jgi:putative flippase GtrA